MVDISIVNGVYKPTFNWGGTQPVLVRGAITMLKNDGLRQWCWDYCISQKFWKITKKMKPPTSESFEDFFLQSS